MADLSPPNQVFDIETTAFSCQVFLDGDIYKMKLRIKKGDFSYETDPDTPPVITRIGFDHVIEPQVQAYTIRFISPNFIHMKMIEIIHIQNTSFQITFSDQNEALVVNLTEDEYNEIINNDQFGNIFLVMPHPNVIPDVNIEVNDPVNPEPAGRKNRRITRKRKQHRKASRRYARRAHK